MEHRPHGLASSGLGDDPVPPRWSALQGTAFVRFAIAGTVLLVLAMTGFIAWRWERVPEPTTVIMIYGDPSLDGASITVAPIPDQAPPGSPVQVVLDDRNKYQTPIYRMPGQYHVTVTWEGHTAFDRDLTLQRFRGLLVNLPTVLTVLADDSYAGAHVVMVNRSSGESFEATLEPRENNRVLLLADPGQYTMSVTRSGTSLGDTDFLLLPHTAKTIELKKKA